MLPAARVGAGCNICDRTYIEGGVVVGDRVTIKRGATVGAGAVVLPGVTIGDRAMVGAGAVVTKDVEPDTVVVGNPARVNVATHVEDVAPDEMAKRSAEVRRLEPARS